MPGPLAGAHLPHDDAHGVDVNPACEAWSHVLLAEQHADDLAARHGCMVVVGQRHVTLVLMLQAVKLQDELDACCSTMARSA